MVSRHSTRASILALVVFQMACQEPTARQIAPGVFHQSIEITVVNMIPYTQSDEVNQDSEPNLAVNPNNPLHMVGTAFTPDPMEDRGVLLAARTATIAVDDDGIPPSDPNEKVDAPVYVSTDGGDHWRLECIVPEANSISGTRDITVEFGPGTNDLYAGMLRGNVTFDAICSRDPEDIFAKEICNLIVGPTMDIRRTVDFESGELMELLHSRKFADQPYLDVESVGLPGASEDRVFAGYNDVNFAVLPPLVTCTSCDVPDGGPQDVSGRTASVTRAPGAPTSHSFSSVVVEPEVTAGQNGPAVRTAASRDGTVYAVFYHWTTRNEETGRITTDVVVVRDDDFAAGEAPFRDLVDPVRGNIGSRVVVIRQLLWADFSQPDFGQERFVSSDLSIAADPRNSATVYVAWADVPLGAPATDYTLHVRRSGDSGSTWSSQDLLTVVSAKNPALAVSSTGTVGFLYQEVARAGSSQRWVTHFRRSANGTTWDDLVLADVPADEPRVGLFLPYIGDYVHLTAVDDDFYGVFSANNTPDLAHFPQGIRYQRRADFENRVLLSSDLNDPEPVAISIDPFFFKVVLSNPFDGVFTE